MSKDKLLVIGLVVVSILFLVGQLAIHLVHGRDWSTHFTWGLPFQGYPLQSFHVDMDCEFNGKPICCALLHQQLPASNSQAARSLPSPGAPGDCTVVRSYMPSPYELRHIAQAKEISILESESERRQPLLDFVFADLPHSIAWLQRVEHHMRSSSSRTLHLSEGDMEYLSRFRVSRTCGSGGEDSVTWYEWIEPLTVHTRHPFALANCSDSGLEMFFNASAQEHVMAYGQRQRAMGKRSNFTIMNTDYVLLAGGPGMHSPSEPQTKAFLFDAGTSTFDSSLFWFLCAYRQRGLAFDAVYGWEATLLEPNGFWKRVPPFIQPMYHFFNTPISARSSKGAGVSSVMQMVQAVARREDFVSFKLDIDTPSVELPVVLQLLQDSKLADLVDELFFELHFRCEFLMHCGWGTDIPYMADGLVLDRLHAMELFQQLREMGIRAHFWP